jgi:Type II secretion system (T2SS), protein F
MNPWVLGAGLLAGLGAWLAVSELVPARPSLRAAVERLDASWTRPPGGHGQPLSRRLGRRLRAAAPWLPVPVADLRLLGQDPDEWLVAKICFGVLGLALAPALTAVAALAGHTVAWTVPAGGSLALGAALFFAPDLVTRANAAERRTDFRHAVTSYLDLVALERGAGAAPTEALEAAAAIGGGWTFERIAAALDTARKAGRPPWEGLASLAAETGVTELADLAEIAGIAGQDGARILDTLAARADSMRAQALAATRAQAGSRSTTMVLPIAMLAGGFLVLLIFPDFYRLFG